MSAASFGAHNSRTYGKKASMKRKQTVDTPEDAAITTPSSAKVKRRRMTDETPTTPPPHNAGDDADTDIEESTPVTSKVDVAYDTSQRQMTGSLLLPKPPKPVRDLSRIFESCTPSVSPAGTPSRLSRRMLARSKTESSVESQSQARETAMDRTSSLPTLPSSPSTSMDYGSKVLRSATPVLPLLAASSKQTTTRTYAGKFRSFLVTLPASSSGNLSQNIEDDEGLETRESYSSLRSRWGVDNSEDDPHPYGSPSPVKSTSATPDGTPSRKGKGKSITAPIRPPPLPTGMMNPLKSISELRNKGESRRFLDEVGYLFEGLDKNGGIGLRRASALEIITKLCDSEFTRKAKAADFFSRTLDLFLEAGAGGGDDKILDTLLVIFLALVARDVSSLSDLFDRPLAVPSDDDDGQSLLDVLVWILSTVTPETDLLRLSANPSRDDAAFKQAGILKKDRTIVFSIYKVLTSKADLFYSETPISIPLIISYTLQSLQPSFISLKHLPTILASLRLCLSPNSSSTLSTTLSLKWTDAAKLISYDSVYYHLRLLDASLLGPLLYNGMNQSESQTDDSDEAKKYVAEILNRARDDWLAEDLLALGLCIELMGVEENSESLPLQKCLDIALRMLVSLTHSDEAWSWKVAKCDFTIGFLMRTIRKAGDELQLCKSHSVKQEEEEAEVKAEQGENSSGGLLEDQSADRTESQALDTLCLALGLLTNLVQRVDEVKQLVRDTRLNPSCPMKKRACAKKCTCFAPSDGLQILVALYVQQSETSALTVSLESPGVQAEAEASFLRGHLAVLFGLLMMGSSENQSAILGALPSPFTVATLSAKKARAAKRSKLSRLVDQAKDFVAFYTVVSNRLGDAEKESKVAKEVVRFLERQRDEVLLVP